MFSNLSNLVFLVWVLVKESLSRPLLMAGQAHTFRQAVGEHFTLVEATVALLFPMQGHRDDAIDFLKMFLSVQRMAIAPAQRDADFFLALVFEIMDQLRYFSFFW